MTILPSLAQQFQNAFPGNAHGRERAHWFVLTLQAILMPLTASRTSNLLRSISTLFGVDIAQSRYYTFMASTKLPWERLWRTLWRSIQDPLTDGRLLLALDDSINPKTGRKVFACQDTFDHAAKANQSAYPWAQTIVTVGLLKSVQGRWACLPLAFAYFLRAKTTVLQDLSLYGKHLRYRSKFRQAVDMIERISQVFTDAPVLVVADSWFGNQGLMQPLRTALGHRAHLLSRLRVNAVMCDLPKPQPGKAGRPRKYGQRLGNTKELALDASLKATTYKVNLYGRSREVRAHDRVVMLKSLRAQVRVVWIFRRTQWVALVTTDLDLSVTQVIEYYGARWKIESGFREIKQEIGSAQTQTRTPEAVTNHLHFCMMATTLTWVYGQHLEKAPPRRYATQERSEYAFADLRRALTRDLSNEGFGIRCPDSPKPPQNTLIARLLALAA